MLCEHVFTLLENSLKPHGLGFMVRGLGCIT